MDIEPNVEYALVPVNKLKELEKIRCEFIPQMEEYARIHNVNFSELFSIYLSTLTEPVWKLTHRRFKTATFSEIADN